MPTSLNLGDTISLYDRVGSSQIAKFPYSKRATAVHANCGGWCRSCGISGGDTCQSEPVILREDSLIILQVEVAAKYTGEFKLVGIATPLSGPSVGRTHLIENALSRGYNIEANHTGILGLRAWTPPSGLHRIDLYAVVNENMDSDPFATVFVQKPDVQVDPCVGVECLGDHYCEAGACRCPDGKVTCPENAALCCDPAQPPPETPPPTEAQGGGAVAVVVGVAVVAAIIALAS